MSAPLSAYPECRFEILDAYRGPLKSYFAQQRVSCVELSDEDGNSVRQALIKFTFEEQPEQVAGNVVIKLVADRVELISFGGLGPASQPSAIRALSRKFGRPTFVDSTVLQNGFGARIGVLSAAWKFGDLEVEFDGADDNGRGRTVISTSTWRLLEIELNGERASRRTPL
jgi:hypothetical protein